MIPTQSSLTQGALSPLQTRKGDNQHLGNADSEEGLPEAPEHRVSFILATVHEGGTATPVF